MTALPSFLVAQLGARMHYAVPRILHSAGMLDRLCTDICAATGWVRLLEWIPKRFRSDPIKRLVGRHPDGIPPERITAFTAFGFDYARRRARATSMSATEEVHLWAGKRFAELVVQAGWGRAKGVYAFNSAALELLRQARAEHIVAVLEQTMAPYDVLRGLLAEEQTRFPDWEGSCGSGGTNDFSERERREWDAADLIVCGSDFVVEGIRACRGPADRCVVVPYGVNVGPQSSAPCVNRGPLRVLTVGEVGLRKGSPYVLAAAREMKDAAVFRMVGNIGVSQQATRDLAQVVELTGPVPRPEMVECYRWADVFLLPSLCEGSATAVYEALAYGLPVICTPNTGSVVRDGQDGFIVPIRDPGAIIDRLGHLMDPVRRDEMRGHALSRAGEFTVEQYGKRLIGALTTSRSA